MVLQRDKPIPVWGNATPGSRIMVELANQKAKTVVGEDGKWRLHIKALKAGGPHQLSVTQVGKSPVQVKISNVLIGDVWFASGQSNMEWQVSQSQNAAQEIKSANHPEIRFFMVPHAKQVNPQDTLPGGSWAVMDTAGVKSASAVAYFFARDLQASLKIPIGVVQSTWGGTPVEAWTSREKLEDLPITKDRIRLNDSVTPAHFIKDSIDLVKFWNLVYQPIPQLVSEIPQMDYDDANWPSVRIPRTLKDMDIPKYEGIVWLRKTIDIGSDMQEQELTLDLGRPEMNYSLYFNGEAIAKNIWNANLSHSYKIPGKLVKRGRNVITLRMAFLWGGGGFNPPASGMYISNGKSKISLASEWKYRKDLEPAVPVIKNYHRYPTYLFNAMINPVIPYGIKGFIWYQGEDNTSAAGEYQKLFPALIQDWRSRWRQGELPFLYVQLANYMKVKPEPSESEWAALREAQAMTLTAPNTAMAVTIDIGEAEDIHPKNKQEVGRRLALLAKKQVYNQKVQAQGPVYQNHKVEGSKIRVQFQETGSGLASGDKKALRGFAVAGGDGKFYWAEARIDGSSVIVSAPEVKSPHAVRYAWADNPDCNLVNSAGLPALPFRTDAPGL